MKRFGMVFTLVTLVTTTGLFTPRRSDAATAADKAAADKAAADKEAADKAAADKEAADKACRATEKRAASAESWKAGYVSAEQAASKKRGCSDSENVLCLDARLRPEKVWDSAPREVSVGDEITVVVLIPQFVEDEGVRFVVTSTSRSNPDALFPPSPTPTPAPARSPIIPSTLTGGGLKPPLDESCDEQKALNRLKDVAAWIQGEFQVEPPAPANADAWAKFTERKNGFKEAIAQKVTVTDGDAVLIDAYRFEKAMDTAALSKRFSVSINRGRYYADVGILAAAVINGRRQYYEVTPFGVGDRTIGFERDTLVTAAIVVEAFPFGGRRRNTVWVGNDPNPWAILGIQAGTSLASPGRSWFLGVALEPIAGISFDIGGALVPGDYLPQGVGRQQAIPPGQSLVTRELLMPRMYLGVTGSLEVLNTARAAVAAARTSP